MRSICAGLLGAVFAVGASPVIAGDGAGFVDLENKDHKQLGCVVGALNGAIGADMADISWEVRMKGGYTVHTLSVNDRWSFCRHGNYGKRSYVDSDSGYCYT